VSIKSITIAEAATSQRAKINNIPKIKIAFVAALPLKINMVDK